MPQPFIGGLSISRAPLQASTSSSCATSGKPSRTRNSSSFHEPRRIFTLPARHCELNGPNRVSLSPLSGAVLRNRWFAAGEIGGRLFVVNRGPKGAGYLWCSRCEYAEPAPQAASIGKKIINSPHQNPRTGEKCPNEDLNYPLDLGHVFETDVRAIGFSAHPPAFPEAKDDRERADKVEGFLRTLAESLRLA